MNQFVRPRSMMLLAAIVRSSHLVGGTQDPIMSHDGC